MEVTLKMVPASGKPTETSVTVPEGASVKDVLDAANSKIGKWKLSIGGVPAEATTRLTNGQEVELTEPVSGS